MVDPQPVARTRHNRSSCLLTLSFAVAPLERLCVCIPSALLPVTTSATGPVRAYLSADAVRAALADAAVTDALDFA
jgi:hypothetical protein